MQNWPETLGFSMAPWGYTIDIKRNTLTIYNKVEYVCLREECGSNPTFFTFDPYLDSLDFARDKIYKHLAEKH
jgi:hypothetical protein